MRVLIVDDEAPARDRLARLLAALPDLVLVGQAADGEQALAQVAVLAPDLILLDVQMPGASGLDVAASLPRPAPAIVFVTAHDRHAVAAFDAGAIDYLLKPVDPARLALAVQRVRERAAPAVAGPAPAQLLIADRGRTHVVAVAEILWLEAADNYVTVHGADRSLLMRRTLTGLLGDLGEGFVRTHRGAAVALAHALQIRPIGKGDAQVVLRGGALAPCSRQYRADLVARLARLAPR